MPAIDKLRANQTSRGRQATYTSCCPNYAQPDTDKRPPATGRKSQVIPPAFVVGERARQKIRVQQEFVKRSCSIQLSYRPVLLAHSNGPGGIRTRDLGVISTCSSTGICTRTAIGGSRTRRGLAPDRHLGPARLPCSATIAGIFGFQFMRPEGVEPPRAFAPALLRRVRLPFPTQPRCFKASRRQPSA